MTPVFLGLPPGTPRLLIPQASAKIQSQAFLLYSPSSRQGQFFCSFGKILAQTGLLKPLARFFPFSRKNHSLPAAIEPLLSECFIEALITIWAKHLNEQELIPAISLGTPNAFQKLTVLLFGRKGIPCALVKVGQTVCAKGLIRHEAETLGGIAKMGLEQAAVPRMLGQGEYNGAGWLMQSVLMGGSPSPLSMGTGHWAFLKELAQKTRIEAPLETVPFFPALQKALEPEEVIAAEWRQEERFIRELRDRVRKDISNIANTSWPLTAAHGDFSPWNIRVINGRLAIYDWEYFLNLAPAGWDVMRFIFVVEHLLRRQTIEQIVGSLEAGKYDSDFSRWQEACGITIPDRIWLGRLFFLELACDASRRNICGQG